jgi:hypothetical protein
MAKPRVFLSLLIAVPIVVGIGRVYRPYLGTSLGAALDLLLVAGLAFVIVRTFQRFED